MSNEVKDKNKSKINANKIFVVYAFLIFISMVIIGQIIKIQFVEGDELREKAEKISIKYFPIEADRGNIYDRKHALLATSAPFFDLRFDVASPLITDSIFNLHIDSLCLNLSTYFNNYSQKEYKTKITQSRQKGDRYLLLKRNITFSDVKEIKKFPIFRMGVNRGGLILEQKTNRIYPYGNLGLGVIGIYNVNNPNVRGIEGAFNTKLEGISGKKLYRQIPGRNWRPVSQENDIDPKDGLDVQSTIDIGLQDVTEKALLRQIETSMADHGSAVIMKVETGEILAIANVGKNEKGEYQETYNYAISESFSPGSTFKLASILAAFEDSDIKLDDKIDVEGGSKRYANRVMKDSHLGDHVLTVQQVFQKSSNVGISKIVMGVYADNPRKFIDRLCKFELDKKVDIELKGESKPFINSPKSPTWSKISLPWLSMGYESSFTPLQILNFYNSIANDGIMVKPRIVRNIEKNGIVVEELQKQNQGKRIASKESVRKARFLLEKTVEEGTGSRLKNSIYRFAGKTGTAEIANRNKGYSGRDYLASFVGYFPAENPKYSCIVVIAKPRQGSIYGGSVAAPVVREIADQLYASDKDFAYIISDTLKSKIHNPLEVGNSHDIKTLAKWLHYSQPTSNSEWIAKSSDSISKAEIIPLIATNNTENIMPNLIGMSIKDAMYLCQRLSSKIQITGTGKVISQSPKANSIIKRGEEIILNLSMKNQKEMAKL